LNEILEAVIASGCFQHKKSKQIFASKYKTIPPTEKQLAAMIEKKNARLVAGK